MISGHPALDRNCVKDQACKHFKTDKKNVVTVKNPRKFVKHFETVEMYRVSEGQSDCSRNSRFPHRQWKNTDSVEKVPSTFTQDCRYVDLLLFL